MRNDLQTKASPWSLRNTGACVFRCSWYNDLGHRGRGRCLGRHLGLGRLLREPERQLGLEWRTADCAPTVHVVGPFRTPTPPCVKTLDPPFCAGLSHRNSSPSPSKRQNQAPLWDCVRKFQKTPTECWETDRASMRQRKSPASCTP